MRLPEKQPMKLNKMDKDNPMRCHRCNNTMVYQKFYGPHEYFWGWRCIWCGDVVDRIILENRSSIATGQLRR